MEDIIDLLDYCFEKGTTYIYETLVEKKSNDAYDKILAYVVIAVIASLILLIIYFGIHFLMLNGTTEFIVAGLFFLGIAGYLSYNIAVKWINLKKGMKNMTPEKTNLDNIMEEVEYHKEKEIQENYKKRKAEKDDE